MWNSLILFSIRHKLLIGLCTLALLFYGGYSLTRLPIDALPDITNNQVQVMTTAPTLAAQEIEQFITYPLEQTLKTIPRITELRSISQLGLSVITIVFEEDADIYWARALVQEKIREAEEKIPAGIGRPELAPLTTGLGEIYQYVLFAREGYEDHFSARELRTIQDWLIKPRILGTPGVAEVSTLGGYLKQYEIKIDPGRLRSLDLSISDVFRALENNNENTGGAYIDKKPYAYFIRGIGLVSSISDIEHIVIKNTSETPLLVRDVGTVQEGSALRYGAVTKDGKGEMVGGMVLMLKNENSAEVVHRVKEKMEEIKTSLPEGVGIEVFIDRTKLVDNAIRTVKTNLIEGALIVVFVLVLLLGNFRAGLLVASVIPLAMCFALIMMRIFGLSGNLMSLGAIDFGLLVDGTVIIVEAALHRLNRSPAFRSGRSLSRAEMDHEIGVASTKIRSSAMFGEIIILIVYLPILTLIGIEGKMFKPMAQTVSFAILGAFILSLTYVPMMSALVLQRKASSRKNLSDRLMNFLQNLYQPVIEKSLQLKALILTVAVVLFAAALWIFSSLGGEFIPTLEEGDFAIHARIMPGSSLSQSVETTTRIEQQLQAQFPEVETVVSKIGSPEIPTDPMPIEASDIIVVLKPKKEWTSASTRMKLQEKMKKALAVIPEVSLEFSQPVQLRFNELMTGVRSDVAVKIFGEDLDILSAKALEAQHLISNISGVADLKVEQLTGLSQVTVRYDWIKMARYGLSIKEVNEVLKTSFAGSVAGIVYEGEKRFDLVVRLDEKFRTDIRDIRQLPVRLSNGAQVPLEQVAAVNYEDGPMRISREQGKRRVVIGFNVRNRDIKSVVEEVKQKIDGQLLLPPGYYLSYGGQFENLKEASARLSVAVPFALVLIFILLYFTFQSTRQALLIFTAIPLSAIGGVLALWLRGMPFSISAGIGFIALFGVAVLNGIVLIGSFNELKKEGITDLRERILRGTRSRLRPVLLTASVASLGFIPMALSTGAGAEVQKPLATVVIGGLVSATLLTLLVLPVLYMIVEPKKQHPILPQTTLLILLLSGSAAFSSLQAQPASGTTKVDLNGALQYAFSHNRLLQSQQLEVEAGREALKTASELPRTAVVFQYGQWNSKARDNGVEINQEIPFPGLFSARSQLAAEQLKEETLRETLVRNEIAYQVRLAYYESVYLHALRQQWIRQDSIYSDFLKAAELRYTTGESSLLEKTSAETRRGEMNWQLRLCESQLAIALQKLRTLMGSENEVEVSETFLPLLAVSASPDSQSVNRNPQVLLLQQQAKTLEQVSKVEKRQLAPSLSLRYINQTFIGYQRVGEEEVYFGSDRRFQGAGIGLNIPLWFRPHRSRLEALELRKQALELQAGYGSDWLSTQLNQAFTTYYTELERIAYFREKALPNSRLLSDNAQQLYRTGSISYIEYIQALDQSARIERDYLEALWNLDRSAIYIYYLNTTL